MDEDQANEAEQVQEIVEQVRAMRAELLHLGASVPEHVEACWTLGEYRAILWEQLEALRAMPTHSAT